MNILVTGAKGFVGKNLVTALNNIKEKKDKTRVIEVEEVYEFDINTDISLLDEPELSFHLEWQGIFLNSLETISQLRSIQCIVCTHSPEIFRYQWNMSIDLFKQLN